MQIDIDTLCTIARAAGEAIMEIYGKDDFAVEIKEDNSPLTAADRASHEVIVDGLERAFPAIPILSEEGADIPFSTRSDWSRFWLVDPLDGTKEFIKRNGEFTVNIALIEGQIPVLGVVYVPAQDKMYWGVRGEGAWLVENGGVARSIQVRNVAAGQGLTVVMSRSHPSPELEDYLKSIKVAEALPVGSSLK
ncbi:MAG: 3'(2'),5'-bisphosphate nucleotidase CysQ, partial [Desulfuromonas sp.]